MPVKLKTKREAVSKVSGEFKRRERMARLTKYTGTFRSDFLANDAIEAADRQRQRLL